MSYHLMDNVNIASMEEKFFGQGIVTLNLTGKTNMELERGGQMNLHIITQLILIQFYNLQCNNMISNMMHTCYSW